MENPVDMAVEDSVPYSVVVKGLQTVNWVHPNLGLGSKSQEE